MNKNKPNPIENFVLQKGDIHFIGKDLRKPTSIITSHQNSLLWITDERGGIVKLNIDSQEQELIQDPSQTAGKPNSLLFLDENNILIANLEHNSIEVLNLIQKKKTLLFDCINSKPFGKVNFLLKDSKKRIWLSISTRQNELIKSCNPHIHDGYIALIENNQPRIVADGFSFTNEIRLDRQEQFLYISETGKKRIVRMRVSPSGELFNKEVYGPSTLGMACFPDGITFDQYGNLWGTIIGAEKIFAITPKGDLKIIYDDSNQKAVLQIEEDYQKQILTMETLLTGMSHTTCFMTSLTFAGKDRRTIYLGNFGGNSIPYFKAPVAGQ